MSLFLIIFWLVALLILAGLGFYAWRLTRRLHAIKQQQQAEKAAAELQLRNHQQELMQDIHFIARAMLAEQCDITEGVMRLQYLIDGLDADVWQRPELETIRQHWQATNHMPILEAYQALSRQEQFRLDSQRLRLEDDNKNAIFKELNWLVTYQFSSVTLLQ